MLTTDSRCHRSATALLLVLASMALAACAASGDTGEAATPSVQAVTVMSFNVENLFDVAYFPTAHNNNNIQPGAPRLLLHLL